MRTSEPRPSRWPASDRPAETLDDQPGTDPGIGPGTVPPPAYGNGRDPGPDPRGDPRDLAYAVLLQSERIRMQFEAGMHGELRQVQGRLDHLAGADNNLRETITAMGRLQSDAFRRFEAKQERRMGDYLAEMKSRTVGPWRIRVIMLLVLAGVCLIGVLVYDQHEQLGLLRQQFQLAVGGK